VTGGRRLLACVALAGVISGGATLAGDAWLAAKAALARRLIDRALDASLADGRAHRPWEWADTWPVASLDVPRLGLRRVVLAGASGSSLAFGPGLLDGTAPLDGPGQSVVAGHRDGSFAFLAELRVGDEIVVRTPTGARFWRVDDLAVRAMDDARALVPLGPDQLTLVTCWPFGGLTHSHWRYVVRCLPLGGPPIGDTGGRE